MLHILSIYQESQKEDKLDIDPNPANYAKNNNQFLLLVAKRCTK